MEVYEVFDEKIKTDPVEPRTTLNDLPHQLLFEIFSWLPLTTMFCIRRTCKLLHNLATDPTILAIQVSRQRQRPISVGHLLSLSGIQHKVCYVEKVGPSLRFLGPIVRHREHYVSPYPRSSGGLVLYEAFLGWLRFYYVENPITGERIQIQDNKIGHISHGFGYSSYTKEYKIVQIGGTPPLSVAVFTLGLGHWRRVGDAPFYPDSNFPFECDGLIFWKVIQDQKAVDMNQLVMSFDVASECFRTWRGPALGKNINRVDVNIAKIGTCAACVYGKWSNTLQIWVMRDMGKDVWVKEHNIFCTSIPRVVFDERLSSGSWIGKDVFFGRNRPGLFGSYYYCFANNDGGSGGFKMKMSPIQGTFLGAMDHIGSLVSPLKLINQGND